jgi:hypothetical protein
MECYLGQTLPSSKIDKTRNILMHLTTYYCEMMFQLEMKLNIKLKEGKSRQTKGNKKMYQKVTTTQFNTFRGKTYYIVGLFAISNRCEEFNKHTL